MLRMPTYSSIQCERRQFCCQQSMEFVEEWSREKFTRRAPAGDERRYFEQVVQDGIPVLWEDQLHDITGVYVFLCSLCERVTAYWDIAQQAEPAGSSWPCAARELISTVLIEAIEPIDIVICLFLG